MQLVITVYSIDRTARTTTKVKIGVYAPVTGQEHFRIGPHLCHLWESKSHT